MPRFFPQNKTKPSQDEKELSRIRYTAQAQSWYTNGLELDKSLLTISAGGVGLSFTIIQLFSNLTVFYFMVVIAAFFTATIGTILLIFHVNGKMLHQYMALEKNYLENGNKTTSAEFHIIENKLNFLDSLRNILFFIGVVLFFTAMFFVSPTGKKDTPESNIKNECSKNFVPKVSATNNINIAIEMPSDKNAHKNNFNAKSKYTVPPIARHSDTCKPVTCTINCGVVNENKTKTDIAQ